jgi:hypothetical protein
MRTKKEWFEERGLQCCEYLDQASRLLRGYCTCDDGLVSDLDLRVALDVAMRASEETIARMDNECTLGAGV